MVAMLRDKRERAPQRDRTVVLALVVLRRPDLVVELPASSASRRPSWPASRRPAPSVGRPLERGEVDERLEHRSRLPPRDERAVVLRLVVRAPADHREDLAGPRIDRRCSAASARPLRLAARQQLVDARSARRARRPAPGAAGADRASCRRPRPRRWWSSARDTSSSSVWST